MIPATLKQIAERTGKSAATVSLVLNSGHFHRVSEKTRIRIFEAARELNYMPNLKAQALANGKTRTLAITAMGMTPFYNEYIRRLTHMFEKYDYSVFVFEAMQNPKREAQVVQWVRQGLFDGCICLEYNFFNRQVYEPLVRTGIPHVFRGWNTLGQQHPEHMLRVNYRDAIRELFAHLENEGWNTLSVVIDGSSYMEEPDEHAARQSIYHDLLRQSRLRLDPQAWIVVPFDAEDHLHYVYERVRIVLSTRPDVDALIVQSASEVPAVYKAAADCGRTIGADLAVATFDRIPLLDFMTPPVTYIYEANDVVAQAVFADMMAQLTGTGPDDARRPELPLVSSRLVVQCSSRRRPS